MRVVPLGPDTLAQAMESRGLLVPPCRVLVAYSGGADSTALLHLLHRLGYDAWAGHLHHGQRPEADEEMSRCERFCAELNVPFVGGRADVPRLAKETGMGLEEAGRHARYEFLERARMKSECDWVVTGHTADDQVETVLFNLARGTGLAGLGGIPIQRGRIVRPMLGFWREQTRAYCRDHGLWYHDDPSNEDCTFARARVRHRLVPEYERVHPGAKQALIALAESAREEDAFLDGAAAAALERAEVPLNGALGFLTKDVEVAFRADALLGLPRVLAARAIRLLFRALGGEVDRALVQTVLDGMKSGNSGSATSSQGLVVAEWGPSRLHVSQQHTDGPFGFPLAVPGETESDLFGWVIEAFPADLGQVLGPRRSLEVVLDAGSVRGELAFRSAEPGDRISPLGMAGSRKLSDLMGEAGFTRMLRKRLPVVVDEVGPVWLPGVCIADRVKITDQSLSGWRLALRPRSGGRGTGLSNEP